MRFFKDHGSEIVQDFLKIMVIMLSEIFKAHGHYVWVKKTYGDLKILDEMIWLDLDILLRIMATTEHLNFSSLRFYIMSIIK